MEKKEDKDRPWWRGAVIYQIYPRSFLDTDGDGVGNLEGITRRLDYVASLGVDAIWLSPFYPSANKDFGYDIIEHCQVDPVFGTMEDFDALLAKAKELGLKVIIDAVLNHTSDQHPWFLESRHSKDNEKANWYEWRDPKPDGSPPNNWISRYGTPQWTWCPEREQYFRHQYLPSQPSLNLANDAVLKARMGFMEKWLARGVDGLRFDAVPQYYAREDLADNPSADVCDDDLTPIGGFSPFAWQLHVHDCNDERIEGFVEKLQDEVECRGCTFTFSEIDILYRAYDSLGRYTGEPYFNAAYTPDFMEAPLLPSRIARVAERTREKACLRNLVWCATNHDAVRLATRWAPEGADDETCASVSKLAAALLACVEGQVSFFQGEELGLPDADYEYDEIKDPQGLMFWPRGRGRDPIRHPFPWDGSADGGFTGCGEPWLPTKDEITRRHAAGQEEDRDSVLHGWRRLIGLRQKTPALKWGEMRVLEADDESGLLRFERHLAEEAVEAAFNLGPEPLTVPRPDGTHLDGAEGERLPAFGWRIVARSN